MSVVIDAPETFLSAAGNETAIHAPAQAGTAPQPDAANNEPVKGVVLAVPAEADFGARLSAALDRKIAERAADLRQAGGSWGLPQYHISRMP